MGTPDNNNKGSIKGNSSDFCSLNYPVKGDLQTRQFQNKKTYSSKIFFMLMSIYTTTTTKLKENKNLVQKKKFNK